MEAYKVLCWIGGLRPETASLKEKLLLDSPFFFLYSVIKFLIGLSSPTGLVLVRGIVSEGTCVPDGYAFFRSMDKLMRGKTEKYLDLLALRLAEVRLSQLGFRFVPGVYPVFRRISQSVEALARIVKAS